MIKRKILVLIFALLVLNNAVVIGHVEASVSLPAPVIQTAVFQLVFLVRLPFMITTNIVQENTPLLPEFRQPVKNQNTKKDSDDKKDSNFFFSIFDKKIRSGEKLDDSGKFGVGVNTLQVLIQDIKVLKTDSTTHWFNFVYFAGILCIALKEK